MNRPWIVATTAFVLLTLGSMPACETPPKTSPTVGPTSRPVARAGSPLLRPDSANYESNRTPTRTADTAVSPASPPADPTSSLPWNGPPELGHLAGKVVFIDFFGAWCGSCEISSRYMQVIHERFISDPDVEILAAHVGSNYDRWDSAADYLDEIGVSYSAIEDGNDMAAMYDVDSLPAFVLLDREGNNVYQQQGMFASNINSFISMIEHEVVK